MANVKIEDEIGAAASAVWALVNDFGGVATWAGG